MVLAVDSFQKRIIQTRGGNKRDRKDQLVDFGPSQFLHIATG